MKYGYARVSTIGQDLSTQLRALKEAGCTKVYKDKFTGNKTDRPNFKELLSVVQEGDTLVITKLDRFARSTIDAIQTIKMLFDKGVRVHILNMGLVEDTPTGRLVFNIMSSFAEFERDMIIERTQEGKALAKQRDDFKEGRPRKHSKQQVQHALQLLKTHSYKEVENKTGINKRTLMRRKSEQKAQDIE